MASEEDINNQERMNNAREEERDYIRESYEFLGETLDIGAKIADQLKSIVSQVKDKTTLDKETLKRSEETVKVISNLKVDYTDMSEVQKDMKKIEDQRTKNLITISALSKQITQEELNHAKAAIKTEEQYSIEAKILEDNIAKRDAIEASIKQQEALGINVNDSLYEQLEIADQQVNSQQSLVAGLQAEAYKYADLAGPQAMQVALLEEQNKGLEEVLRYLGEEEEAINKIRKAMGYWNVSLGAVKGFMEGIGLESAAVTLGLEDGQKAAEAMADRLTRGGQDALTFIGKFRVLAAGVSATTKTLFNEVGAALLAIFSVRSFTKLIGSFFKPLVNFVGDLKQKVTEAFDFIRSEFLSLDSFIADYQEGERLFFSINQAVADTATNLGVSTEAAQELYNQTSGIAKSVGMLPEEFLKTAETLNQTFGTTKKFSDDTMKTLAQMTNLYGLSAEEASKLTMQAELQGQSASDYNLEAMETVMVLKERYNIALSEQEVIKATANASDSFKLSVGNSAKAIADAAFQAKRLGLEMSDVENMSSSLLDFESSIAKEMEAELLLGRDLNLDKARQFALNNDISGVTREVAKQIGSAGEFTKMNRIQQEALADSIGVSRDELSKMLQTQELLAGTGFDEMSEAQERFKELVKETGSEEKALALMREQGATEALTKRMREISAGEKRELQERAIAEAQMKIAEAAIPMVNAFLDFLKYIKEIKAIIVQEMKPFFKAFSGLIKSAGREMKDGMVSPAAKLGKTLNNVGLTLIDLGKKYLPSIVRMFTSAYSVITSIFNVVGKIVSGLAKTKDSTEDTKNIFESISNFLLKVADYINNINVDPIIKFAESIKNIFDKVWTVVGQIANFVKENPKLVAGGALVIGGAVAAKKTYENMVPLGSKMRPMTVIVKNTEDFGGGGGDDESGGVLGGLVDKLKDKVMGGGEGGGPSAFDLAKGKGLSDKQILAGFGGKEAMEEMKSALSDGLQDKVSDIQDGLKDRVLGGGGDDDGGGGGGGIGSSIGGGLSSIGKGIGDFGKGVGKGIGGIFKGLASGLTAFANPAILLGATILSGSIAIIAAGIAGATYIFSKVLPSLAEGMKSLEELDGKTLAQAGGGMAAIGGGLLALAAGGVAATGAALAIGALTLMGPGVFKPIEDFGKLNLDPEKIKNNAAAVGYWAAGMAALAVGSAGGAMASFAGIVGNLFDGIAGFFGGGGLPEDKMQAFAAMNLDPEKMQNNAKAVAYWAAGMAALAVGSSAGAVASLGNLASNVFDGLSGLFGKGKLPMDKVQKFGQYTLDVTKTKNNAEAVVAYTKAMAALAVGSSAGAVASLGNLASNVFDGLSGLFGKGNLPMDKVQKFGQYNLDVAKTKNNAEAVVIYTKAMASLAGGSFAGAISSYANMVGSAFDGVVNFFGKGNLPMDKVQKFGQYNLNLIKTKNNAEAVVAYTKAMASLAKGSAAGAIASYANMATNLFDGISNFFGRGNLPMDKVQKFGQYNLDAEKIKNNASAVVSYGEAMSALGKGEAMSFIGSLASAGKQLVDGIVGFFGGETKVSDLPIDEMKKFGEATLPDPEKIEKNAAVLSAYSSGMVAIAKASAGSVVDSISQSVNEFFGGEGITIPLEEIKKFGEVSLPENEQLEKNSQAVQSYAEGMNALASVTRNSSTASIASWFGSLFGDGGDKIPIDKINEFGRLRLNTEGIIKNAESIAKFAESLSSLEDIDIEGAIENVNDSIDKEFIENLNLLNYIKVRKLNLEELVKELPHLSKIANIIYINQNAFTSASKIFTPSFIEAINLLANINPPTTTDYSSLSFAAEGVGKAAISISQANDEYDIKNIPLILTKEFIESISSLSTIIVPTQDFTLLKTASQDLTQGLIVFMIANKEHNIRAIDDVLEDDVIESINLLQNINTAGLDFNTLPATSEKLAKALTIITSTPAFLVIGDYLTRKLPTILNRVNQINFDKVNFEAMDQMSDKLPRLAEAYSKFGNLNIKKLQLATKTISDLSSALPTESFVDQTIRGIEAIPSMLGSLFKEGVDGVLEIASPEELNEVKSSFGLETNTQNNNEGLRQELRAIKTLLEKVTTRPIELDSTVTVELDGNKLGQTLAQNNYRMQ